MDKILTVTELSSVIKSKLEGDPFLTSIWVKGELSNVTYHSSGHIYFTLKDKNAVISAAFFKYANKGLKFRLEEGQSIIVMGSVTVYEKRGAYQMIIADVSLEGVGELQKQIEQLKKKLSAEGIFDAARKKKIPFLPKRVGVVTSPTGAAFRDILKVALRRYPTMEIILAPAKVQGDDAAATIVRGIEELNNPKWEIDVIIAGRGGGSFEDLMPFNEESVVRAFAASKVPIISAVGHQIDHPLSDDAADLFAPTPSAAAEIAVPVMLELLAEIDHECEKMERSLSARLAREEAKLALLMSRRVLRDPSQMIYMKEIELSDLQNRMIFALKDFTSEMKDRFAHIPDLDRSMAVCIERKKNLYLQGVRSMEQLSPLGVIARGYCVALDTGGDVIKSVRQTAAGERIALMVHDGRIHCTVLSADEGALSSG